MSVFLSFCCDSRFRSYQPLVECQSVTTIVKSSYYPILSQQHVTVLGCAESSFFVRFLFVFMYVMLRYVISRHALSRYAPLLRIVSYRVT
jgi:hypothetical protein